MQKLVPAGILVSRYPRLMVGCLCGSLAVLLLLIALLSAFPAHADTSPPVRLTSQNFGGLLLSVTSKNLSDSSHASFELTNRSQLWYGLEVQSTPSSLKLQADDPAADPLAASFASVGLLQPSDLIPVNADLTFFEHLDLAVSFTAPDQQVQVTLNPLDWKAGALDFLGLVLDVLGLDSPKFQTGLLKPGQINAILDAIENAQAINQMINDFISGWHALSTGEHNAGKMVAVASDLLTLWYNDPHALVHLLALVVQGALPESKVLQAVLSYPLKAIYTKLKLAAFFVNCLLTLGTWLYDQQQLPTVLLQTSETTASAYPSLASAYQGTAQNNTFNASSSLVLTDIEQDQQVITGKVFWGNGLVGDGTFIGSIDARGTITFTDTFPTIPECCSALTFTGRLSADGSLSGTYTSTPSLGQPTQHGTWQVKPYQPAANPHLGATYNGMVTNLTVNVTTTLALTNIVQNQQAISGNIVVGPGLNGTGTFAGTMAPDGSVTFTDSDVVFTGFLFPDGALSGTYIVTDAAQDGTWQTTPG